MSEQLSTIARYTRIPSDPSDVSAPSDQSVPSVPSASSPLRPLRPLRESRHRTSDLLAANALANLCEQYLLLTRIHHMTLVGAARQLGKSPSYFSGPNSVLSRYLRGGIEALLPPRREAPAKLDLVAEIERLGWFVHAARFFYANTNCTSQTGSIPEAVRRTIALPKLPSGWRTDTRRKFMAACRACRAVASGEGGPLTPDSCPLTPAPIPVCPSSIRDAIRARERAGQPIVPDRIARQIEVPSHIIELHRRPHDAGMKYVSSPGSSMYLARSRFDPELESPREFARAGSILEADDGTINFPVCIPWNFCDTDPDNKCCSKFGVLVGRFQWLRAIDVATRFRPAWAFIARPRSSYRGEDILALLRTLCLQHGIWQEYRFERGSWESNLVTNAIDLLGANLHTVNSARGKPYIEGGFSQDWTKLSIHFPHCDLGRWAGDTEETNKTVQACRAGNQDPRKLFPMLADAIAAFQTITAEENATPVNTQWGRWVPAERWQEQIAAGQDTLRPFQPELAYAFCPFVRDWTVHGTRVTGAVPLFEDISPEFSFSAHWLAPWDGQKVRCYFDPRDHDCHATIVAISADNGCRPGEILGQAEQINETAGYIRTILGWGDDPHTAGLKARQQTAAALRRELQAVVPSGRAYRKSEQHDGISATATLEVDPSASPTSPTSPTRPTTPAPDPDELASRLRRTEDFESQHVL